MKNFQKSNSYKGLTSTRKQENKGWREDKKAENVRKGSPNKKTIDLCAHSGVTKLHSLENSFLFYFLANNFLIKFSVLSAAAVVLIMTFYLCH